MNVLIGQLLGMAFSLVVAAPLLMVLLLTVNVSPTVGFSGAVGTYTTNIVRYEAESPALEASFLIGINNKINTDSSSRISRIPLSRRTSTSTSSSSATRLFAESSRVRFNNDKDDNDNDVNINNPSSSLVSLFDQILTFIASDYFSIGFGLIGLLCVVIHRWNVVISMPTSFDSINEIRSDAVSITYQTRSDLLAVFACGSVLLNGVTKLDVTTALAESVVLDGTTLAQPEHYANTAIADTHEEESVNDTLSWALRSMLVATPAKTAIIITPTEENKDEQKRWTIRSRAGIVPSTAAEATVVAATSPILDRVGNPTNTKETYLPTLQALPGRTEFVSYLPTNTQCTVMIPISTAEDNDSNNDRNRNSVLVLGGNTAKSFSPRDIAWSRIIAERIGEECLRR